MADTSPVIVIDTREQEPLAFLHLAWRPGTLQTGDYSVAGLEELFAVERKSIADLVACCAGERERFERELHRLRGYRFKRLLIVGTEQDVLDARYRSRISPQSVLGSLAAFETRYDIPIVWCPTPDLAARQIERWAFYFARECVEAANGLCRAYDGQADVPQTLSNTNP